MSSFDEENGEYENGVIKDVDAPVPCKYSNDTLIYTQSQLNELISISIAGTITVMDPRGYCRSLLNEAIDASDVKSVINSLNQILDSCRPDLLNCRKIVILDIRGLPRRPRKPWNKLVSIINDVTSLTKITVILYTDDPLGRPRWINIDDTYVLCSE